MRCSCLEEERNFWEESLDAGIRSVDTLDHDNQGTYMADGEEKSMMRDCQRMADEMM